MHGHRASLSSGTPLAATSAAARRWRKAAALTGKPLKTQMVEMMVPLILSGPATDRSG